MTSYDYQLGKKPFSMGEKLVEPTQVTDFDAAIQRHKDSEMAEVRPQIDQLRRDHPGMPAEDEFDYPQMFSDGKVPVPNPDGEGLALLPEEYYKSDGRQLSYDLTTNSYQPVTGFDRVMLKGSRDVMQGMFQTLVHGPYAVGRAITETGVELGIGHFMDMYQGMTGKERASKDIGQIIEERSQAMFERYNNPPELPEVQLSHPDTAQGMAEEIAVDVLTILADIGIGNKLLGVTRLDPIKATKWVKKTLEFMKRTITQERGVILGEIAYSKTGHAGNLSTMLNEFGIGGDLTKYLDSTQFDSETDIAMKNVMEGVMISKLLQIIWASGSKGAPAIYNYLKEYQPKMAGLPGTQKGMVGWHGSPHSFDEFKTSQIGTGEGAQAYGHGLYFAENQKVANKYQFMNAEPALRIAGKQVNDDIAMEALQEAEGNVAYAIRILDYQATRGDKVNVEKAKKLLQDAEKTGADISYRDNGYLYEVDIPDEQINKMLDWDVPLGKQSPEAVASLRAAFKDHYGRDVWDEYNLADLDIKEMLDNAVDDFPAVGDIEKLLNKHGIPGIKYLDGSSRGGKTTYQVKVTQDEADGGYVEYVKYQTMQKAEQAAKEINAGNPAVPAEAIETKGTRNFVVFDEGSIKILSKDGKKTTSNPRSTAPAARDVKYSQYADQYPDLPAPVFKVDKKTGKEYWGKGKDKENTQFMKDRARIQKSMNEKGYTPYFEPEKRFDADPDKYPQRTNTRTEGFHKKTETTEKWRKKIHTDDARKRLQDAYDVGIDAGYHDNWYAMGQLEKAFIDELGDAAGTKAFRESFSDPMAATTGGADPTANLLMAMYGNFLRKHGEEIPGAAYDMPSPIGGRYVTGNMAMYNKVLNRGDGLGVDQPKRHNFSANFEGHKQSATIDEQMADLITPGTKAPPPGTYGIYEELIAELAKKNGITPREFQDIAWGGKKVGSSEGKYAGKPMIEHVNDAIERTSRLTGQSPEEVLKRGIIRGETPVYAHPAGTLAAFGMTAAIMDDGRKK